jgi:hypothetical protein
MDTMRPLASALAISLMLAPRPLLAAASQEPAVAASPKLSADDLKARERHALLTVRTVVMAGKNYATSNGGLFGELGCLTHPESCGKAWPADAPFPLDPSYRWDGVKLGYVRRFLAGPKLPDDEALRAGAAPGSLKAFAFTVAPEKPGETGLRAFCGDTSGRLCVTKDGREPPVKDGRCDPCQKLE